MTRTERLADVAREVMRAAGAWPVLPTADAVAAAIAAAIVATEADTPATPEPATDLCECGHEWEWHRDPAQCAWCPCAAYRPAAPMTCKHCGEPIEGRIHPGTNLMRCLPTSDRPYGYNAEPEGTDCVYPCLGAGWQSAFEATPSTEETP